MFGGLLWAPGSLGLQVIFVLRGYILLGAVIRGALGTGLGLQVIQEAYAIPPTPINKTIYPTALRAIPATVPTAFGAGSLPCIVPNNDPDTCESPQRNK